MLIYSNIVEQHIGISLLIQFKMFGLYLMQFSEGLTARLIVYSTVVSSD